MCKTCGCVAGLEGMSEVERIKAGSKHLRGTIKEELSQSSPAFGEENATILKFHGVYQQDDRDRRKEARQQGLDKRYIPATHPGASPIPRSGGDMARYGAFRRTVSEVTTRIRFLIVMIERKQNSTVH